MKLGLFLTFWAITFIFAFIGVAGYYVSYKTDSREYPWAYSSDKNKSLLVGKWSGKFVEPDSIEKKINLEIYEPYTKLERIFYSIGLPYQRRLNIAHNKFNGYLTIEKGHSKEHYKVRGSVNLKNIQLFDFHLLANEKDTPPYHFSFFFTDGFWEENKMSFVMTIVFRKNSLPNNLKNFEPSTNKKIKILLNRI